MPTTMTKPTRVRVNPSRATCEEIIRRILTTEKTENGGNHHFKTGADFMTYFESLYPSGPALTKQVQRAIRSMGLAKDEQGYFLIDKTKDDQAAENELSALLKKTSAAVSSLGNCETVLLSAEPEHRSYLASLVSDTKSLKPLYHTIIETFDGILFLTSDAVALQNALNRLIGEQETT